MTTIRKDEQLIFIINDEQAGQTVREFLQGYHLSRKKIHEMYMNKKVRLNGNSVSFETILHASDELAIALFEEEEIDFLPQKMPLEIIYEDDHLLIINKPAGLMVHPDQKDGKGTLANGVAYYYERRGMKHRVRYIHRLDTETSGGIIFAKTYLAHSLLCSPCFWHVEDEKGENRRTNWKGSSSRCSTSCQFKRGSCAYLLSVKTTVSRICLGRTRVENRTYASNKGSYESSWAPTSWGCPIRRSKR